MRQRVFLSPTTDEETETLRAEGLLHLDGGCFMLQTQARQAHPWPGHPKRFKRPLFPVKHGHTMHMPLSSWASVELGVGAGRLTGGLFHIQIQLGILYFFWLNLEPYNELPPTHPSLSLPGNIRKGKSIPYCTRKNLMTQWKELGRT